MAENRANVTCVFRTGKEEDWETTDQSRGLGLGVRLKTLKKKRQTCSKTLSEILPLWS